MRHLLAATLIIVFYSCNNSNSHYTKKKMGNYLIEANFIDDSIIDGKANTYNLDGRLLSATNYRNGIKHGLSINFFSNGKVYDSINFTNGLENGYHYVYDSLGLIGYIDFYLNGHQLGPEIFYKKGIVNSYYFTSFEKFEIYNALYDVNGKLSTHNDNFINASIYSTILGDVPANGIFCYFIYPPTLNISYELITRDSLNKKEFVIRKFENEVFMDTVIEKAKPNSVYCIKGILKDSLNKKEVKVFYDELILVK